MGSLGGRRVLVTGADGFVPSYVCERLVQEGAEVTGLVRRNSSCVLKNIAHLKRDMQIVWGDVLDLPSLVRVTRDIEIVYHLAANSHVAYSIMSPAESVQILTMGTLNVLEAARINEVQRIIHAGSAEEYGETNGEIYITEDHPLLPRSPYAAGKVAADRLLYSYWCSYGTPVVMSRFFGVYGPRQSAEKAIPKFILQALAGIPISIYGDGTQTRDFMYGTDAGTAYVELGVADNVVGRAINIGTGVQTQIIDIATSIVRMLGTSVPIIKDGRLRPGEAPCLVADPRLLRQTLEWRPAVEFEDGLRRTVEYYQRHRERYEHLAGRV